MKATLQQHATVPSNVSNEKFYVSGNAIKCESRQETLNCVLYDNKYFYDQQFFRVFYTFQ
jgi:hypothetical protein